MRSMSLWRLAAFDVAGDGRDGPHDVVVVQVVVAIDLDFLIAGGAGAAGVIHHAADVLVELGEGVAAVAERAAGQLQVGKLAVGAGLASAASAAAVSLGSAARAAAADGMWMLKSPSGSTILNVNRKKILS